ncbi:hypothetical protein M427DRAFT_359919 [Gonapodya prolifera JEL478]|uniref:Uncharacterized protein n=1 Tax=Gonapodya prolifera (strain JEL478) TaxID=1344416 RepID=A0A139ABX8_GONPJ|nr:hypothetical protein M427DRAFT_359919 [Gonapodya prolifera JEL478]|eukprot:KXS13923.1 hypothetical protein M427DRAFT_359919 [Gonapodya prolifera JEL478]
MDHVVAVETVHSASNPQQLRANCSSFRDATKGRRYHLTRRTLSTLCVALIYLQQSPFRKNGDAVKKHTRSMPSQDHVVMPAPNSGHTLRWSLSLHQVSTSCTNALRCALMLGSNTCGWKIFDGDTRDASEFALEDLAAVPVAHGGFGEFDGGAACPPRVVTEEIFENVDWLAHHPLDPPQTLASRLSRPQSGHR